MIYTALAVLLTDFVMGVLSACFIYYLFKKYHQYRQGSNQGHVDGTGIAGHVIEEISSPTLNHDKEAQHLLPGEGEATSVSDRPVVVDYGSRRLSSSKTYSNGMQSFRFHSPPPNNYIQSELWPISSVNLYI